MGEEDLLGCQIQKPRLFWLSSLLILIGHGFSTLSCRKAAKREILLCDYEGCGKIFSNRQYLNVRPGGNRCAPVPLLCSREVQLSWGRASLPLPVSSGATRSFGDPLDGSGFPCPHSFLGIPAVALELELGNLNCPWLSEAG